MSDLKNKVVVITGAANGLGRALAIEFFSQGSLLVLMDIDMAGLERIKQELDNREQKISIHQVDVSNEQEVIAARMDILSRHPQIDILVNNAGVSISQYFMDIGQEDFKRILDINFWGTLYCTRHFLPDMVRGGSRIVNIISGFALMGFPGKTAYGASKSAIMGFSNALNTELVGSGVKVCLVIPPPLDTGLVKNGKHIDALKREQEVMFLKEKGQPLERTASRIVRGIRRGKERIVIGTMMFWTDLASRLFPTVLHRAIGKRKGRFDFL